MLRRYRWILGLTALLATASQAHAQYGYGNGGYGGWGGWGGGGGSTVQGSIARGMGVYAAGLGQYNVETAQARAINASTTMQWNEYLYQSQRISNANERMRLARRQARDSGASAAIEKRINEAPLPADIDDGNALNAALDQITNPGVHSSALRLATTKLPGKLIRDIPFFVATEAATVTLDRLTDDNNWPLGLRDSAFDNERKAFTQAVDKVLKVDTEGDLTSNDIKDVRTNLQKLRVRYEAHPAVDPQEAAEATNYLKTLYVMVKMMEKPDLEKALVELDTIKETTLGSLLGFMHVYNLRFGKPQTPAQKAAYRALYPQIDDLRDRVLADSSNGSTPPAPAPSSPTNFLSSLPFEHLDGSKQPAAARNVPKPPQP